MKDHKAEDLEWLPEYREIVACQEETRPELKTPVLPPENLAKEERIYWEDYDYMTRLLPVAARECFAAADAILDRYEFEDSAIYMEYPDKLTIQKIADTVYETLRHYEENPVISKSDGSEIPNPYYCAREEGQTASPIKDLVFTMTAWNISYRRQRYYRRRKVFPRDLR